MGKLLSKYREAEELILNKTRRKRFLDTLGESLISDYNLKFSVQNDTFARNVLSEIKSLEAFFDVMAEALNDNTDEVFPSCMNKILMNLSCHDTRLLSGYEPRKRAEMKRFLLSKLPRSRARWGSWDCAATAACILNDFVTSFILSRSKKIELSEMLELLVDLGSSLDYLCRDL